MGGYKQMECRIVLTRGRPDRRTEVGMYDPVSGKYAELGAHGPDPREVDRVVAGLAAAIQRAGHRLTWGEVTGPHRGGWVRTQPARGLLAGSGADDVVGEVVDEMLRGVGAAYAHDRGLRYFTG